MEMYYTSLKPGAHGKFAPDPEGGANRIAGNPGWIAVSMIRTWDSGD